MSQEMIPYQDQAPTIGQVANSYAARSVFSDYQGRIAENTKRRQRDDLHLFARFLAGAGLQIAPDDLYALPETWQPITLRTDRTAGRKRTRRQTCLGDLCRARWDRPQDATRCWRVE
jgi:hypothetical protein